MDIEKNNSDKVNWIDISRYQKLKENYIRKFKDKVDWMNISYAQKLSEKFIREFQDKVEWYFISQNQKLSENFIREFKDKVNWNYISYAQKLSENFIREFQDKVNWQDISHNQDLSENFIREFQDKMNWNIISTYQILSKAFIEEFEDKVNINLQLRNHHNILTLQEKQKIVEKYCDRYRLEYDNNYLYAFREHDMNGSGIFNKTISYEKNKYYRDWRCDLDPYNINSFGLGIFQEGNIKVKVKIEDIGCWVNESNKLRVWGFEII